MFMTAVLWQLIPDATKGCGPAQVHGADGSAARMQQTGEMLRQQWCLFYGTATQLLAHDSGICVAPCFVPQTLHAVVQR